MPGFGVNIHLPSIERGDTYFDYCWDHFLSLVCLCLKGNSVLSLLPVRLSHFCNCCVAVLHGHSQRWRESHGKEALLLFRLSLHFRRALDEDWRVSK